MRNAQNARSRLPVGAPLTVTSAGGRPKAVFFGCSGPELLNEEAEFFADADPFGFILFKRNCENPDQVSQLTADLRESIGRPDAPVLIDEEGGRVQRLGPPAWPDFPAAEQYGAAYLKNPEEAESLVQRAARAQASQLYSMGITANAAPVLDLKYKGASAVVGERSYSDDPAIVTKLGRAVVDGLMSCGVMPVIKHMPGHGRARVDSHVDLPRIDADLQMLDMTDFAPFKALNDCPWGMVGHLLITAADDQRPASCSASVIEGVIREKMGFEGLLLSDDLSMGALSGSVGQRAAASLDAGCDVAVHCNGVMEQMRDVSALVGPLTEAAERRIAKSAAALAAKCQTITEINVANEIEEIVQALASS